MYTIGDFLIQIKNAYMSGKKTLSYPRSNMVFSLSKILEEEGYVKSVKEIAEKENGRKTITIELIYRDRKPAITNIKLLSKPSIHRYVDRLGIKKTVSRHGIGILSTSKGVMTSRRAQKEGVGGELICQIT